MRRREKSHLTIAIDAIGGKHRSVSLVETLGKHLRIGGHQPKIRHRDMGKRATMIGVVIWPARRAIDSFVRISPNDLGVL